jgi:Mitochondrial carrier protein
MRANLLLCLFNACEILGFVVQYRIQSDTSSRELGRLPKRPSHGSITLRLHHGRSNGQLGATSCHRSTPSIRLNPISRRRLALEGSADDGSADIRSPSSALSGVARIPNGTSESVLDLTPLAFGSSPEQQQPPSTSSSDSSAQRIDLPLSLLALAGSVTTLFTDVIMHPVDCIKILQQSDAGYGLSLQDAALALWERDGVSGFYSGFLTYAVSDAAGGALKFTVWEQWKRKMPIQPSISTPKSTSPTFDFSSSPWFQWVYLFVGAALAFVASSVAIVPGEFVKNQLQMDRYDGLWEAVAGIMTAHGISGFFVGYEGVMYRDVPYTMLELGLYEVFKTALFNGQSSATDSSKPGSVGVWNDVLAAALTGGITEFLTTPLDVIKTKLMVDDVYAGYSFLDCWLATVDAHGIGSVFAGVVARIAWILPFVTIYLPTYDFLKRLLWQRHVQNTTTR